MTDFTISGQSHIIDDVIEHLKNGSFGFVTPQSWNYEIGDQNKIITLKNGAEVKPDDLFWFKYLIKD
ncbi:hypothetical protein GCM10023210_09670 [Chryseobacterium ginsengisoli]|uniref:Uncharacterized protein n=1 Tax=Chryseobacterium ginsengisoli TaxID=363853 RepID=A0ABP9M064_9FLAO